MVVLDGYLKISRRENILAQSLYFERNEHLNKICQNTVFRNDNNTLLDNRDLLDHILVDTKHHLLYCYVPKVACTNWKRIFMMLTGITDCTDPLLIPAHIAHDRNVISRLSNYTTREIEYFLRTYTKFLFVRHPFERLLSAYRNKLERNHIRSKYFQNRFGRYIIKRHRIKPTNISLENGDDVTFEEFSAYLTTSIISMYNEHWKPINSLCEPCLINYDFIGKYETLSSDSNFLLRNIGVNNIKFPFTFKSSNTSRDLKNYFSTLSTSRVKQLYDIYEQDFKLFSYNLHDLLGYEVG
ncbi:hypothetical protein AAG570_007920 [Ranatra chinensis]|uniref:Carbohydrate sulfotransferase n=1 Tax=Ranatra chinensis TaxID=642074 RepID=A0ABD0YBU9_9HEMI